MHTNNNIIISRIQCFVNRGNLLIENGDYTHAILYLTRCLEESYDLVATPTDTSADEENFCYDNGRPTFIPSPSSHGNSCVESSSSSFLEVLLDTSPLGNCDAAIYQQPLQFTLRNMHSPHLHPSIYAAVIFNLALAHHLLALSTQTSHTDRDISLRKAAHLYNLTLNVQCMEEDQLDPCDFLVMASLNNSASAYGVLQETQNANDCYDKLIALSMFQLTNGLTEHVPYFDCFFRNALKGRSHSKPAPAA